MVTSLPNMAALWMLANEKVQALRAEGKQPAVVYFDIIAMHSYNTHFGYDKGNELIRLIAETIDREFGGSLLGRGPDDHFVLLYEYNGDDEIRENGHRLWIDDFGSGYSSLNVITQYPVDRIKVDMDIIRHMDDNNGANRKILKALVGVCRELGMHTLSEGVETKEQQEFLSEIECEMLQGFYFYKPIPLEVYLQKNP